MCTQEVQLVRFKEGANAFVPLHIENFKMDTPTHVNYKCDPWKMPILVDDTLLERFIYIANIHLAQTTHTSDHEVTLTCTRSCLKQNVYSDLLTLSIK